MLEKLTPQTPESDAGGLTFTQMQDAMKGPLVTLPEGGDKYFKVLLEGKPVFYTPIEKIDIKKGMTTFPLELHCWKTRGKISAEICYRTPAGLISVPNTEEVDSSGIASLVRESVGYSVGERSREGVSYANNIRLLETYEPEALHKAA